jgi:hypothetical protein
MSLFFLIGLSRDASAGPIRLDNDAEPVWADIPCGKDVPTTLCTEPFLVFGAPRFVPDARNAGEELTVAVDFLSVAIESPPPGNNTLFLNVGDSALNQVLRPGTDVPLQLSHQFAPTGSSTAASDVVLKLREFEGFELLPPGDLIFTVEFKPKMSFTGVETGPDRPGHAVIITLAGPGVPLPEPSTAMLLLSGLISGALGVRFRRAAADGSDHV